jgi:hypothetical protein
MDFQEILAFSALAIALGFLIKNSFLKKSDGDCGIVVVVNPISNTKF